MVVSLHFSSVSDFEDRSDSDTTVEQAKRPSYVDAIRRKLKALHIEKLDAACDICNDEVSCDANAIAVCSLCGVHVHQLCYCSELLEGVPDCAWYCGRCNACVWELVDPAEIK